MTVSGLTCGSNRVLSRTWNTPVPPKRPNPTLGHQVLDWIIENLTAPDKAESQPFIPTFEQARFIQRYYEIDPLRGKRKYRRGVLSRSRGWGKSPLLAALACVEALGPVVFDGWDANGDPVGKPWASVRTPLVQIAAVSEAQTKNSWSPLLEMLDNDTVVNNHPGLEPLDTFVNLPRGKIEPVTSAATSRKGNRAVFAVMDQALALDTPIPTPSGWTTMGQLDVGDLVYGSAGAAVRVSAAKPVSTNHDCYRVTFADGTSVVASEGHLWQTSLRSSAAKPKIRTTGTMARDGRVFRVPVAPAFEADEVDFPAHPYLLGLWLGDGTRGKCEISVHGSDLDDLQGVLTEIGVESWPRRYTSTGHGYGAVDGDQVNLSFTRSRGYQAADRPEAAKAIALLACYKDKHVPAAYLQGSIAQRTAVVQGLMDSDGCSTIAGTCTFVNTNRLISDSLVDLLRSLGQVTTGVKTIYDDRYTGGVKYRVDFTPRGGFIPFRLARKVERVHQHNRSPKWITITKIEPVERVPVRCIAVESDDLADRESLLAGLAFVYGDSADVHGGWVDLDTIVATIWDPGTDVQTARADFLNQITHASDSWLSSPEWEARKLEQIPAAGELITLGFDGSRERRHSVTDATALIGCRVSDGHLFELGVWEQPDGMESWRVPVSSVEAAVRSAFLNYRVAAFYADPPKWETHVAGWEAEHGADLQVKASREHPVEWWTGRPAVMVAALDQFHSAVLNGDLTHSGEGALTRHVLNARRRPSRSGIQIAKEFPESPRKIDAAVAAVLAWQARLDVMARPQEKPKTYEAVFA
jgi:hypothetical protein